MLKVTPALLIHGGVGLLTRGDIEADELAAIEVGLLGALAAGRTILEGNGSALDAVEAAVRVLEDHPFFNAGVGSVLTTGGQVEMDASLMEGRAGRAGAVAAVGRIRHPVSAARAVMERTEHVLLVGPAAEVFATESGLELVDPASLVTEGRQMALERARAGNETRLDHEGEGTVGAVALDASGSMAAATSTGGVTNKRPGRVGDSPVIGAGTWASDATCAVSATGHGEAILRTAFAHEIDAEIRLGGRAIDEATRRAVARAGGLGGTIGCVALDRTGRAAMPFSGSSMFRGWWHGGAQGVAVFEDD